MVCLVDRYIVNAIDSLTSFSSTSLVIEGSVWRRWWRALVDQQRMTPSIVTFEIDKWACYPFRNYVNLHAVIMWHDSLTVEKHSRCSIFMVWVRDNPLERLLYVAAFAMGIDLFGDVHVFLKGTKEGNVLETKSNCDVRFFKRGSSSFQSVSIFKMIMYFSLFVWRASCFARDLTKSFYSTLIKNSCILGLLVNLDKKFCVWCCHVETMPCFCFIAFCDFLEVDS